MLYRTPKISIVIPTYNQDKYIEKCIKSIQEQSFQDYEVIIINDGSTDNTDNILDYYQKKDSRIRTFYQKNKKLPKTLNKGFSKSKGTYLTWISSDNYLHPHFLEKTISALEKNPEVGLVYTDLYLVNNNNISTRCLEDNIDLTKLLRRNLVSISIMYRRECYGKVGKYDPKIIGSEDWDYWIRIRKHYKFKHLPKSLQYFRIHDESMTAKMTTKDINVRQHEKNLKTINLSCYNKKDLLEIYLLLGYYYKNINNSKSEKYYREARKLSTISF